jgi:hypothetical protein
VQVRDKLVSVMVDGCESSVTISACAESIMLLTKHVERDVSVKLWTDLSLETVMSEGL